MVVTAADKKANTKAYQNYKAGDKRYKAADHMGEEVVDEAMSNYDRARKRAAQRAADRNAARAAGKTGVVPGVGYVSPRKERETYVDSAGTTRHKSGAKMEEVENVDEALTGQRQMRARDMKGTPYQKGGGKRTARDNKTLHNLATRNEGPGTPGYEKKSTGGKGGRKYAGYGDQGAGNKARRRAGEQPMRGNRDPRKEEIELTSFKKIQEKLNLKKTQWGT